MEIEKLEYIIKFLEELLPKQADQNFSLDAAIMSNEFVAEFRYYNIPVQFVRDNDIQKMLNFIKNKQW